MRNSTGCIIFCLICLVVVSLAVIFDVILAKVIIWLAAQLFNIDWSDKFLPVFVAVVLLTSISVKISKDK